VVKNAPANNGKVRHVGVSYDGLTAADDADDARTRAEGDSEQASPADQ